MDRLRAIRSGIDHARTQGKEGDGEWPESHPLFNYWWKAVNLKADHPDVSESRVINYVLHGVFK